MRTSWIRGDAFWSRTWRVFETGLMIALVEALRGLMLRKGAKKRVARGGL